MPLSSYIEISFDLPQGINFSRRSIWFTTTIKILSTYSFVYPMQPKSFKLIVSFAPCSKPMTPNMSHTWGWWLECVQRVIFEQHLLIFPLAEILVYLSLNCPVHAKIYCLINPHFSFLELIIAVPSAIFFVL